MQVQFYECDVTYQNGMSDSALSRKVSRSAHAISGNRVIGMTEGRIEAMFEGSGKCDPFNAVIGIFRSDCQGELCRGAMPDKVQMESRLHSINGLQLKLDKDTHPPAPLSRKMAPAATRA
jgi:hypothetical protein